MSDITLYSFPLSGNAHRAQLMLSLLHLPYELVQVDLIKGEQRSAEFIKLNPMSQVPVLRDGETVLADSHAILVYLASKYGDSDWLPTTPLEMAQVQRFLALSAGEIARGPAIARMIHIFKAKLDLQVAHSIAQRVLNMLNEHLSQRAFLLGDTRTIADIACYTYIAHAPEGGIALSPYPQVQAWLKRIEELPGFVPMLASPHPNAE